MTKTILIVGNFGIGALEHQFVKHLKQFNWQVYTFDIQTPIHTTKNKSPFHKVAFRFLPNSFYPSINTQLVAFVKKIKPLVTLVFKGMAIFPETLAEIKVYTRLLCNYNPDHPFKFYSKGSGNKNVKDAISLYDLYGTYAQKIALELKKNYNVNSFVIPFGYDADLKISPNHSTINKFGFIGAYDKERLNILSQLAHFPIEVYGDEKWEEKLKPHTTNGITVTGKPLFNSDYANYCNASLGVFNFLRHQNIIESSHNMRTFEVPGYGGLLIANRTEEQLAFFEEDKEAIYFDSIEELKDKLSFIMKNVKDANSMKLNAYKRALKSNYSYLHRSKDLDSIIMNYLK